MGVGIEVLVGLISAALGALAASLSAILSVLIRRGVGDEFFRNSRIGRLIVEVVGLGTTTPDVGVLFQELSDTSLKMDAIVKRIQSYAKSREEAVGELQAKLGLLSKQEEDLKKRVEDLKEVPLAAAEYFAHLVHEGEKKGALRDYGLFLAGVFVSVVIAIVLRRLGWA